MFLQTLGSYKIPAVIERRRKELLDRLVLLQGGTLKEVPKFAESDSEPAEDSKKVTGDKAKEAEPASKDKGEGSESSSTASSTVTSPNHGKPIRRRDSAVVSSLVKDYESIHHTAKKEEESETPKRFVTLKRVAKPTDFPASADTDAEDKSKEKEESEKKLQEEDSKSQANGNATGDKGEVSVTLDVTDGNRERASSIISGEESNDEDEEESKKKKKKTKKSGGFGLKVKGFIKRDKSPVPERKNRPPSAESTSPPEAEKEEQEQEKQEEPAEEVQEEAEEVPEEEEGVRISGDLGRLKKKIGLGKSAKQVHAKVKETTLMLGTKEELDLANCSVELTDIGFDLTHPLHKSPLMFKVDGDEEKRQKWVDALKEAIEKATPLEEEKRKWLGDLID